MLRRSRCVLIFLLKYAHSAMDVTTLCFSTVHTRLQPTPCTATASSYIRSGLKSENIVVQRVAGTTDARAVAQTSPCLFSSLRISVLTKSTGWSAALPFSADLALLCNFRVYEEGTYTKKKLSALARKKYPRVILLMYKDSCPCSANTSQERQYVCLCMVIPSSRVWINRVRLPILLVVS